MKAKPSKITSQGEIIGRADFVSRLWDALASSSVLLLGQRRTGKTAVLYKMTAEPREGFNMSYLEATTVRDIPGLILALGKTIGSRSLQYSAVPKLRELPLTIGHSIGLEFDRATWRKHLVKIVEAACQSSPDYVVLAIDEFPDLLRRLPPADANFLLDHLRHVRMTFRQIRMLFSGSTGMGHMIRSLAKAGSPSSPLNDMAVIVLPSLTKSDASALAKTLLRHEKIATDADVPDRIAELSGGIPYYIHMLIAGIRKGTEPVSATNITELFHSMVHDGTDPLNLRVFLERLYAYYSPEERLVAHRILNVLVGTRNLLSHREIAEILRSEHSVDEKVMFEVLRVLEQDGYVAKDSQGALHFSHELLKEWWRDFAVQGSV